MKAIPHLRWWIVALLFGAALLNYVDRQTLSCLAPTIQRDLGMDDRAYANVVNIFLVAYTAAYLISGKLVDVLGTRAGMMLFVAWWSVANMLTSVAHGLRSLAVFRSLLGLGEAGIWPAASKAVGEWFPARERALAIGLYTMGATVGAMVAPHLVISLAEYPFGEKLPLVAGWLGRGAGWRMAFIFTGLFGLGWLVPWVFLYRRPRESKLVGEPEIALLERSQAAEARVSGVAPGARWTWRQILTSRVVWLLVLGRFITDPVWYFYQFWFSKYLHSTRGLSQDQLTITWVAYAAAGAGSLIGGWLSGMLVRRGIAPARSRLWIMLGCASVMPLSLLIARSAGLAMVMILAAITIFAAAAWLINISSLLVDLVPTACLGTVTSLVGAGSTIGGVLMNTLVAGMVSGPAKTAGVLDRMIDALLGPLLGALQGMGYSPWFLIMAGLHPVAWLVLWRWLPHPAART